MGATIVTVLSLSMNHFIVPQSNKVFEEFTRTYLKKQTINVNSLNYFTNINLQLGPNDYVFFKNYRVDTNNGTHFSYQVFEGNQMVYKLSAPNIRWVPKDSIFKLFNYSKRTILKDRDIIESGSILDTAFQFTPVDLVNVDYMAKEMKSLRLREYIQL